MTQSEQLALVKKALDRAVGCLSLARNGMLEVTHLTIYTCDAVTTWLAYVVKQEEERVQAEATKGQVTHQEFVEEILRQAEKTKAAGEHE